MVFNFHLELAAFIIGIILSLVSGAQYKITNLKGKVYVHMLRVTTVMTGLNLFAYMVVSNNLSMLMGIAEFIISLSFM